RQLLDVGQALPSFIKWLRDDRRRLTASALKGLLELASSDPCAAFSQTNNDLPCPEELQVNWVWSFLVTLCREIEGKKQSFGAKAIAEITRDQRYTLQNSIISEFENLRWNMPDDDLMQLAAHFSRVLRDSLNSIDVNKARDRFL